ncbi:unnamed protein product [Pleuronectes platessa]|uniref:Uncharacterized protein n=1 Tax=Pleuronectes platessa TaxID=8262 RepID=A0A9N7YMC3_PLEPL|nr:unnamed protein product [Pleuronectes platessa]
MPRRSISGWPKDVLMLQNKTAKALRGTVVSPEYKRRRHHKQAAAYLQLTQAARAVCDITHAALPPSQPATTSANYPTGIENPIEVNLQKALAEASETCTQECLILGHSDSCWMPPALAQFQVPGSNSPTSNPAVIIGTLPSFGFQQSCARGARANMGGMGVMDGRHTLGRSVPKKDELDKGINRPQFYHTLDRHCSSKKEDTVKVIPLATFSSPGQQTPTGGSSSFLHEHQL